MYSLSSMHQHSLKSHVTLITSLCTPRRSSSVSREGKYFPLLFTLSHDAFALIEKSCYANQVCAPQRRMPLSLASNMGWLRIVGSLKLLASFAKEAYKTDYILQKRPVILRSLLIVATPYLRVIFIFTLSIFTLSSNAFSGTMCCPS